MKKTIISKYCNFIKWSSMFFNKFNKLYTVSYLGNVVEGQIIKYLNVPIDEMKKASIKSIKNNEAVWFGCDVGKMFHRDLGVMHNKLYDYELFFGINPDMDKATRLEYGDSQMTHAMLFTGVDIKNNKSTYPSIMGIEESQRKAQLLIDKALAILQELPFETSKLEFLCQLIINRKS